MEEDKPNSGFRLALWLPLLLVVSILGIAAYSLSNPSDRVITSKLVGLELPQFDLPAAFDGEAGIKRADFSDGQPKLLNIFASWCVPCIAEAPHLETLKARGVKIYGVAIRDSSADIARFLERNGNPYAVIASDHISALQLNLGSSGVPETFVIDGSGKIIYQHIGDITANDVPLLLEKLEEAG
jgi:cytochrome c biogenesis protein CcmG/thiol:disulfide interchange protein DsbE